MMLLRVAFAAAMAALVPAAAIGQTVTSWAEPVERMENQPGSRGCAVSFTAVAVNADGSPNVHDGARGSLTLLVLDNGRGLLGVKLSGMHRDTLEADLTARAPAQVLLIREGRPNPQELIAHRPSDTPDFSIASFRMDQPVTSAVLRDLETSGRARIGYRLVADGPMLTIDVDIASRRDSRDAAAVTAWRDCATAARSPRPQEEGSPPPAAGRN